MKYHLIRTSLLSLALIGLANYSTAQTTDLKTDSIAVVKTIDSFVDAFSNLRWNDFKEFFATDATAFFPPSAKYPSRASNGKEVLRVFKGVFDNAKQRGKSKIDIYPKDVNIQMLTNSAIVTFHLDDPDMFGRRTIVLQRLKEKWLIVHLHASGIPKAN